MQTPCTSCNVGLKPRCIHQRLSAAKSAISERHESSLSLFLQSLGTDWDERVLPSIGNEIIKAVVAQYNAEQLLTQRDKVSRAVRFA